MKQSILFVRPDFHCSFFYRDELRELGWKADIFVPVTYPKHLLFSQDDIILEPKSPLDDKTSKVLRGINFILKFIWFFLRTLPYKYLVFYGRPRSFLNFEDKILPKFLRDKGFSIELSLLKFFNKKFIYLPTGCLEQETRENFLKFDQGNVCTNCGYFDRCDDRENLKNFRHINRYFSLVAGWDPFNSSFMKSTHFKYKSINLDMWKPGLDIPQEHQLNLEDKLVILHSSQIDIGRNWKGKNIKGTPFLIEAVNQLKSEGHNIELIYIKHKKSSEMRFYQAQADIVVEQLIYGWWGSTGVECMALGKPVICYIRPEWKDFYLKHFPEVEELPVIEASTTTIYAVLKELILHKNLREKKGQESRTFAEKQFNPKNNAFELTRVLKQI